jgi:hypothetical protein
MSIKRVLYNNLPSQVKEVCDALVARLKDILREKLYGIYMYGAVVFPDSGPVTDIDCHVILRESLSDQELQNISQTHRELSESYPPLGRELDIWYILLDDARKTDPPQHLIKTDMYDESWALHQAHIRAGRYITLYGPEPADIFPSPSWDEITSALEYELDYVKNNLEYPAYCVLNLCRIIYSFRERDVVVSKLFSGKWACSLFPRWSPVIEAALRFYEGNSSSGDENLLRSEMTPFLEFSLARIEEAR